MTNRISYFPIYFGQGCLADTTVPDTFSLIYTAQERHTEFQEVAAMCVVELTSVCAHGHHPLAAAAVLRLTDIVSTCGSGVDPNATFGATLVNAAPQIAAAAAGAGASSGVASAAYRFAWGCDPVFDPVYSTLN